MVLLNFKATMQKNPPYTLDILKLITNPKHYDYSDNHCLIFPSKLTVIANITMVHMKTN